MNLRFYLKVLKVYIRYKIGKEIPFAVEMRLTLRCNLNCSFCLQKHNLPAKGEITTHKVFELIDDMHKMGVPYSMISGGEPLLRKDIEEIGSYLKKKGIVSILCTNGILITKERAEKLVKSYNVIRISFDGLKKTHNRLRRYKYAYEKAEEGLENLLLAKGRTARIGVSFVITKDNYKELNPLIEHFKGKVDMFTILPLFSKSGLKLGHKLLKTWSLTQQKLIKYGLVEQNNDFIKEPSYKTGKKYCDGGRLYLTVNPYGSVTTCPMKKDFILGNIKEESFYNIYKRGLSYEVKEKIKNCSGCYLRGTTEISMNFRKSPIMLLKDSIKILRTYKR